MKANIRQITLVVLAVGIVGNLVFYRQIAQENADAALRRAQMNAKANAPAIRYSHVDDRGVTQHTLCSGGGWCVTDRVPPEDFTQASSQKRSGTMPVIDGALMQQLIEAQRGKGVAND